MVRRFTALLRGEPGPSAGESFSGTIEIAGRRVTGLHLLGGYHRPGITKAGRLSVRGVCEGRPVKVYSAHSAAQVTLRRALQEIALPSGIHFPEIIVSDDALVAECWVSGKSLVGLRGRELADAAEQVRQFLRDCAVDPRLTDLAERFNGSFCYLEDYLLRRLGAWVNVREIAVFIERWRTAYAAVQSSLPRRVSHPDLSRANLILERGSGRLIVVDNELLGVGRGWILDWHNSLLSKQQLPPLDPLGAELAAFASLSWRLRRLGSALDADEFQRAMQIIAE